MQSLSFAIHQPSTSSHTLTSKEVCPPVAASSTVTSPVDTANVRTVSDFSSNMKTLGRFQLLTDEQYEKLTPTTPIMNFYNCNVTIGETKQKNCHRKETKKIKNNVVSIIRQQ